MKTNTILFLALPSLLLGAGNANAAAFPDFTINESSVKGNVNAPTFIADKITGNYDEWATFDTSNNTFNLSLKWNAGQFVTNDGTTPITTSLLNTPSQTVVIPNFGSFTINNGYGLYGLITAQGNYVASGASTTFNFRQGKLDLYIDRNLDTTFSNPANSSVAYGTGNTVDDFKVATGGAAFVSGQGLLDPALVTCNAGINCGSFGVSNDFQLTQPEGGIFFSLPNPFYKISLESGQLNNFELSGTQHINGSLDITFQPVPLPTAAWLFISGMMGLLAINKRKSIAS